MQSLNKRLTVQKLFNFTGTREVQEKKRWMIHDGQKYSELFNYAPLSRKCAG